MLFRGAHTPQVDTSLAKNAISANAYISTSLQVDSADVANIFHQVKVSLETTEEERICLDRMLKGQETAQEQKDGSAVVSSEMSNLELSMQVQRSATCILFMCNTAENHPSVFRYLRT